MREFCLRFHRYYWPDSIFFSLSISCVLQVCFCQALTKMINLLIACLLFFSFITKKKKNSETRCFFFSNCHFALFPLIFNNIVALLNRVHLHTDARINMAHFINEQQANFWFRSHFDNKFSYRICGRVFFWHKNKRDYSRALTTHRSVNRT